MKQFTPSQWLMISIANSYGLDKETWENRISWFVTNEKNLWDLIDSAEEPTRFKAGIIAWEDYKAGKPSGYPIYLDCTASGIQIMSLLTCDFQAAKLTNLINTGNREDIYTYIYHKLLDRTNLSSSITREKVKKAIMTSCYGSKKTPVDLFGSTIYTEFTKVMAEELPLVWELNNYMVDNWVPDAIQYDWVLPDGFTVHCKVMKPVTKNSNFNGNPYSYTVYENIPTPTGRFLGPNMVHS